MKRQIILLLPILLIFGSCSRKLYVPVERVKTEYHDNYRHDSIYITDSTVIRVAGDTVFLVKWKTEFRTRTVLDSVFRTDSIPVPYEVERVVKVEKAPGWFSTFLMYSGVIAWCILLTYIVFKSKKKISGS